MNYQSDYNAKLMTADEAVQYMPARGTLGMGMAASEPPAVLSALEKRLQNGMVEEWKLELFPNQVAGLGRIHATQPFFSFS
jgi:itaconate CoA-transferase